MMAVGNQGSMWSISRYFPYLMIKDIGQEFENMPYIGQPISLTYIARTICSRFSNSMCNMYGDVDLISDDYSLESETEIIIIPARQDATHLPENYEMIVVDRKKNLKEEIYRQVKSK
jgi:hypothetical protein